MPREFRSRRSKRAELSEKLRAQGWTWAQIAQKIAADEHVNMRVALRLAHDWTQESAARRWNELYPPPAGSPGMTDKRISYWETWPITGNEPSLPSYKRLACLYQCDISDLVEDGNFSHLDEAAGDPAERNGNPAADMGAVQGVVVSPGQGEPLGELIRLLSQGGLSGFAPHQKDPTGAHAPVLFMAQESERFREYLVQLLSGWANTVNRREMLRSLGWAATYVAAMEPVASVVGPDGIHRLAKAVDNPMRYGDAAIDHIEAVLGYAQRQDDLLGPQAALQTVLSQRAIIQGILSGATAELRPRLLSLLSNASQLAGWLYFDMGDHSSALFYYEQARTAAHEAHDNARGAYVLCEMSYLATWQRKPLLAVDHAMAAQARASQTDDLPLKAYAHQMAARAYAADGQESALTELDLAGKLLDSHTDGISVTSYNDKANLTSDYGQAYLLLGKHEMAAGNAQAALEQYDASFVRNRAFTAIDLSRAKLGAGNVDEATAVIGGAVDLVACNKSPRLMHDMRVTVKELTAQADTPGVRELADRCAAAGITGPPGRTD